MIYADDLGKKFADELDKVCAHSPFGARIAAYYFAYREKRYSFLDTWLCCENGRAVCALSRYYNTMTVCGKCSGETAEFIDMLCPSVILANAAFFDTAPQNMISVSGETMICTSIRRNDPMLPDTFRFERLTGEMRQLRMVYELLKEHYFSVEENETPTSPLSLGSFDEYFVDLSHLTRHGAADTYAIFDGERIVSSLSVTARSDTAAVISNVVTHRKYRRKGLAEYLVTAAANDICRSGRTAYLHRKTNIPVYEKAGFRVCADERFRFYSKR